jgi:hypothetical protein
MMTTKFKHLKSTRFQTPGKVLSTAMGDTPPPKSKVIYELPTEATGGEGGGFEPKPYEVHFKTPSLPVEAYNGPSLLTLISNWYWGPPPKIEAEVVRKPDPEIDINNCILLFMHALASVLKNLKSAADEQVEGELSEPTGVTEKRAKDDLQQARRDFADCLRKGGASNFDTFRSICESEAKSLVEGIAKDFGKDLTRAKGNMMEFQKKLKTLAKIQNDEVARIRAKQDKLLVNLEKERDDFNAAILEAHEELKKVKEQLATIFSGATKDYTDIVKDTDGLTRVLPSVVKAIETMRDRPDTTTIAAVSKALKTQVDEVTKKSGKDDKQVKAFAAEIEKFEKKWL